MPEFHQFDFRFRPYDFHLLPPVVRVASILGPLFALASIVLLVTALVTALPSFPQSPPDFGRLFIGMNLGMLSGACTYVVTKYIITHFRRPSRQPLPLSSWQSQVQAIVPVAALPTCALILELLAPLTPSVSVHWLIHVLAATISMLAAFVLAGAYIWALAVRA